jgi:uncharacterized damage-inducible protein DinB
MSTQALLTALLQYKASADDELLDALGTLGADAPPHDLRSAVRVLNHAHVVDRIFAAHLQGLGHPYTASWVSEPPPLPELAADIRETDGWYLKYISGVGPRELGEAVDFTFTDGESGRMSREEMLAHVITHGGYHRGEIGRLLPQIEHTAMRDVFAGYLHRSDPSRRR